MQRYRAHFQATRKSVTMYCDKCDFGVFVESMMALHNKTETHEIKSAF